MDLNRNKIIALIIINLTNTLEKQKQAHEQALKSSIEAEGAMQTHHDTTKEETAKLASAYQKQAQQTQQAITYFESLATATPDPARVKPGNLVLVQEKDKSYAYFLADYGGLEITMHKKTISVVSTNSPIGKALLDQKLGSSIQLRLPDHARAFKILEII